MNNNRLTKSIIRKWRNQGSFIRFLNGNTLDCSVSNLQWVSIQDAMTNINNWVVDWDLNLTKDEIKLVLNETWRNGLRF